MKTNTIPVGHTLAPELSDIVRTGPHDEQIDDSFSQNAATRSVSCVGNSDGRAHVTLLGFGLSTSGHKVLTHGDKA